MTIGNRFKKTATFIHNNLRLTLIGGLFCLIALVLVIGIQLRVFLAPPYPSLPSASLHERGTLYDCNGNPLALQRQHFHLVLYRRLLHEEKAWEAAEAMAPIFNDTPQSVYQALTAKGPNRNLLYSDITPEQAKTFNRLRQESPFVFNGIDVEESLKRYYPLKTEAAHVLGFVNIDEEGKGGQEQALDRYLAPFHHSFTPEPACDVFLTLDQNIQHYAETVTQTAFDRYQADYALFIVLDAKNADILAMTCRPTYDPNDLSQTTNLNLINKPVTTPFEPGSVFKIFSIGIALESGMINEKTLYYCDGGYDIPLSSGESIRLHCFNQTAHYSENYAAIIKNSCNAGTAFAVEKLDDYNFYQAIKEFGFGEKVQLGFANESAGSIRDPKEWSARSKATIAIGQELSTTALQLVRAATVYTNNGTLLQPHIVKRIERKNHTPLFERKREPIREVLSPKTAQQILNAMEINTLSGTGKRAKIEGINLSTKTGTGQIYDAAGRGYSDNAYLTSTLAIFPTEDPKMILYGAVHAPKGDRLTGASLVAPLIKQLASDCIAYRNMNKETDTTLLSDKTILAPTPANPTIGATMPNCIGKSKRDILFLYQKTDADIRLQGSGVVVSQEPEAGTPLSDVKHIILQLE